MTKKLEMEVEEVPRGQLVKLLLDGERVSGVVINDLQMRIGRAVVHMGGIGGVSTDRKHRMKGYSRRVMEYSNEYMLTRGYDVSLLFGIQHFYHKFGFACSLPDYRLTLTTRIVEQVTADHRKAATVKVRRARKRDFARIRTIYNRQFARRTGTVVRPPTWTGYRMGSSWGSKTLTLVAADGRGRILSYASFDDRADALNVFELAGDLRTYPALLVALAGEAVKRRVEKLTFFLPPDDPFAIYARRLGGSLQTNYHYSGGGMLRIINLVTLLEKLEPELTARLASSDLAGARSSFTLKTDIGVANVTAADGRVSTRRPAGRGAKTVAVVPQHVLSQLLFGFRTVADVTADAGVRVPRKLLRLLSVLFPFHWPHVSRPDYF